MMATQVPERSTLAATRRPGPLAMVWMISVAFLMRARSFSRVEMAAGASTAKHATAATISAARGRRARPGGRRVVARFIKSRYRGRFATGQSEEIHGHGLRKTSVQSAHAGETGARVGASVGPHRRGGDGDGAACGRPVWTLSAGLHGGGLARRAHGAGRDHRPVHVDLLEMPAA